MPARLLTILALLALLIMPLGMSSPASAMTAHHATSEHCGSSEQPAAPGKSLPGSHCVAGCTVLLPQPIAPERASAAERPKPTMLVLASLEGLRPATGTPPPKQA